MSHPPPEVPLPGKRGFLKNLLGLSAAATIIPIRAEAGTGINPVSYTHLDVYKRQPRGCSET